MMVTVTYLTLCAAANGLQLILSFSAFNRTLSSSVARNACVVDICSKNGADFVPHITPVSLVMLIS